MSTVTKRGIWALRWCALVAAAVTGRPNSVRADGSVMVWGSDICVRQPPAPNTGFTAIAVGWEHALGLKADGSIVVWGCGEYGQWNQPWPDTGYVAVAAGYYHSLGLKADGSIVGWGPDPDYFCDNGPGGQCWLIDYGQSITPSPNSGFVAVAAGYFHSLGVKADGSIVAWGWNDDGQCDVPSPNSGFVAVAGGGSHSLGLKGDGSVIAWGDNTDGQCIVPSPNSSFVAVSASDGYNLGLKADGSIVAWGNNASGQCNVPLPNTGFTAVAAGYYRSFGLKADGSMVRWGYGGQWSPSPNTGFTAIAASDNYNLALTNRPVSLSALAINDGAAATTNPTVTLNNAFTNDPTEYMASESADFADAAWQAYSTRPTFTLSSGWAAKTVYLKVRNAVGESSVVSDTIALVPPPAVISFAINDGAGSTTNPVVTLSNACSEGPTEYMASESPDFAGATWQTYSAAPSFPLSAGCGSKTVYFKVRNPAGESATLSDTVLLNAPPGGTIITWGSSDYRSMYYYVPSPNADFVAVAAGARNCLGLKSDGSIIAWGSNDDYNGHYVGQCNVPSPNAGFVAVAAGTFHGLGLKADGSIVAWGHNDYGQCNVPLPNSGFTAIAAGGYHSLGVKADGSIVAWGNNTSGQCTLPLPNAGFSAVAGGGGHSLGLKADGSIVAWGSNGNGQCNVPAPNTGFVAITARSNLSLGLKAEGSIVQWGFAFNSGLPSVNAGFVAISAGVSTFLGLRADGSIAQWGNNGGSVPSPNKGFTAVAGGDYFGLGLAVAPTVGPFAIDAGASATTNPRVTLNTICTSVAVDYMAAESADFAGATWQAYSTAPFFVLSPGFGTKTVYFKARNSGGESSPVSDTILLTEPVAPVLNQFLLNGDAAVSTSRIVTLNNDCLNEPADYAASESADFAGAAWCPYAPAPTFVLSNGDGTKTVYFKVRNGAGETAAVSDTIVLANQPIVPAVTSFSINSGAASTTSRTVTLNNVCSDLPTEYMAGESSSFAGATWQPYSTAPTLSLSSGNGTKTVYFKVRNGAGESAKVSDTIVLTMPPTVTFFAINNGASWTANPRVSLNNTSVDAPTQYLASESSSFAGATWQPYSAAPSFTVSPGLGAKTVYFKVKNTNGESAPASDSIMLGAAPVPPEVSRFVINNDATATSSRVVTLNNDSLNEPTECTASESPDFAGAAWSTYSATPLFSLSMGSGTKTVYFKVRNPAGESPPVSDTISRSAPRPGWVYAWGNTCSPGQPCGPPWTGGFTAISAGYDHALFLKADGSVTGWGDNYYGGLDVPAPNSGFVAITAGGGFSLGLKADGSIVAWGSNSVGQCNVPAPNTGFISISAGTGQGLGLKADGSIVAWGWNVYGQCNVPAPNTGFVNISAGGYHSLGLRSDGSVVAWGDNVVGQCNVPAPNSGFTAVAAGGSHSLGLKADGSVVGWGRNWEGQCNAPQLPSGAHYTAIAAGNYHSVAITDYHGNIVTWEDNTYGQCPITPSPVFDFAAVAAGNNYTLALSPYCYGDINNSGDIDLTDFMGFRECYNGPNRVPIWESGFECTAFDFDHDGDVDLIDFADFRSCFNGPNRPPACQ